MVSKFQSAAVFLTCIFTPALGRAETVFDAMSKAYELNSTLNSSRAGVRITDENVAIAESGLRPTINGSANVGYLSQSKTKLSTGGFISPGSRLSTGSFGITLDQTLFDGFQTLNNVRVAEAKVEASNEDLHSAEQNTLYSTVSAYTDVVANRQIFTLRRKNVVFLNEQLRAAEDRFRVGDGARTDVAQAQASQADALSQLASAEALVLSSEATYRQVVGEAPGELQPAKPVAKLLPSTLRAAFASSQTDHPAILSSEHLADAAEFSVKSSKGALLPRASAEASITHLYQNYSPEISYSPNGHYNSAEIGATLSVPIYQGGKASAEIRQAKEELAKARIDVDVNRDQVRSALASQWGQYQAARVAVQANRQAISAAQLALQGVIEERNVGQRSTLDVLNAQASLIATQINLVSSERAVVLASYAVLSAIGHLSASRLGLRVTQYKPGAHYRAVRDKSSGLRPPDDK
jgi:outer membrane protein